MDRRPPLFGESLNSGTRQFLLHRKTASLQVGQLNSFLSPKSESNRYQLRRMESFEVRTDTQVGNSPEHSNTTITSPKSLMASPKARLQDRIGAREWAHTASGGKMRQLLGEKIIPEAQKSITRNWDTFLGYRGPPYPRHITAIDILARGSRDTMQYMLSNRDLGGSPKPMCLKGLPKRELVATTAQAMLYLKLRESQYSKEEAIKNSSGLRFKTDSGLHPMKGPGNPYVFNGVQVRVPISDPEHRFRPIELKEEHKDFDMLSQAYAKFMEKHETADGEYGVKEAFPRRTVPKDFKEPPRPYWMKPVNSIVQSSVHIPQVKLQLLPPDSSSEEPEISEKNDIINIVAEARLSPIPREPTSEAFETHITIEKEPTIDHIRKMETFKNGSILYRCVNHRTEVLKGKILRSSVSGSPANGRDRKISRKTTDFKDKEDRASRRCSTMMPIESAGGT